MTMTGQKGSMSPALDGLSTRRRWIAGAAMALGGLAWTSTASAGSAPQQTMDEKQDSSDQSIALQQEVDVTAQPQRIYAPQIFGSSTNIWE